MLAALGLQKLLLNVSHLVVQVQLRHHNRARARCPEPPKPLMYSKLRRRRRRIAIYDCLRRGRGSPAATRPSLLFCIG